MICDRCQGATTPKQITSKKNGQTYTVFECVGTCMNGQYKYSMFAPRPPKAKGSYAPQANGGNEATGILKQILTELQSIRMMLNGKTTLANDALEIQVETQDSTPF